MELILASEIAIGDVIESSDGAEKVLHITEDPRGVLYIEFFHDDRKWDGVMKSQKVALYGRVEGEKELQRLGKS